MSRYVKELQEGQVEASLLSWLSDCLSSCDCSPSGNKRNNQWPHENGFVVIIYSLEGSLEWDREWSRFETVHWNETVLRKKLLETIVVLQSCIVHVESVTRQSRHQGAKLFSCNRCTQESLEETSSWDKVIVISRLVRSNLWKVKDHEKEENLQRTKKKLHIKNKQNNILKNKTKQIDAEVLKKERENTVTKTRLIFVYVFCLWVWMCVFESGFV